MNMAMNIKKLLATDESRSTVIFAGGAASLLAALAVAGAIWQAWGEIGIIMGPRRSAGVMLCALVGILLSVGTGIWALTMVNRLSGSSAVKCILGYLLDASALAIIGTFLVILYYLRASL